MISILLTKRSRQVSPGVVSFLGHMPAGPERPAAMCDVPKNKHQLIRELEGLGGKCEQIRRTGEVRITHPVSARSIRTSHPSRNNNPSGSLESLVRKARKYNGAKPTK